MMADNRCNELEGGCPASTNLASSVLSSGGTLAGDTRNFPASIAQVV